MHLVERNFHPKYPPFYFLFVSVIDKELQTVIIDNEVW